jgi:hypothetical protein
LRADRMRGAASRSEQKCPPTASPDRENRRAARRTHRRDRGFCRFHPFAQGGAGADPRCHCRERSEFCRRLEQSRGRRLRCPLSSAMSSWCGFRSPARGRKKSGLRLSSATAPTASPGPTPTRAVPGTTADDQILRRVRAALDELYGDRIERVVVFGRRARGDAHEESDYDIAVFLKDMTDRWARVSSSGRPHNRDSRRYRRLYRG